MKKNVTSSIFAAIILVLVSACGENENNKKNTANDDENNLKKSQEVVKKLGSTLKKNLVKAMQESGPVGAMEFCNINAMPLTQKVEQETGVQVSRTALKFRNLENKPDEFEINQMNRFIERNKSGEKFKDISFYKVVEKNGKKTFRFMKPLGTEAPCLICHGDNITPELKTKIDELYPNDKAKGFKAGEFRGAFSVKIDL